MIKSLFGIAAATALTVPSAFAGVYVNVENNGSRTGSNFTSSTTDLHVGYEGEAGALGYYIQGGPALVNPDAGEGSSEFSGKLGGSFGASEKLDVYGEISFQTVEDTDNSYGTKVGVKYAF